MTDPRIKSVRPRELRDLYQAALDAGCSLRVTTKGHLMFTTPTGALVLGSRTASDHRVVRNTRAQLRRGGIDL